MTQSPRCPVCGSSAVTPDATNGGAGRNVCHCGHRAAVRDFYATGVIMPDGKRLDPTANYSGAELHQMLQLAPRRVNYVKEPVAAVQMPNGELNDMRHNREPAPIRQYKDD